jgi:Carbohydrate binding module (family 6)
MASRGNNVKVIQIVLVLLILLTTGVFTVATVKKYLTKDTSNIGAVDIKPVSYWEDIFVKEIMPTSSYIRTKCDNYIKNPSTGNSMYHFGSNCVDGFVAMYEATGKTIYLDLALDHTTRLIASTNTTWNGYKDWSGLAGYPLDQSHTWRHVAKMLYVMNKTPGVLQNANYKAKYDQILAFTENNIFKKWWDASETRIANGGGDPKRIGDHGLTYIFRSRTHMASHWAFIGMVLEDIGTNTTMKDEYKLTYTKVNTDMSPYRPSSMRQQMEKYPGDSSILIFHDEWGRTYDDINERPKPEPTTYPEEGGYHPVSDTHHGADTIGYIVEAYEMGKYWTRADVDGLTNLTYKLTWNKSTTDPKWAGFIDGTEPGRDGSNCIEDGQIKLGRYSAQLQKVFEADTPTGCYPAAFYGSGALNAKKLGAAPVVTTVAPTNPSTPAPTNAATPVPTKPAPTPVSLDCSASKSYSLTAGQKWYAAANGYTNRQGLKIQGSTNPVYVAKYDGSQYKYSMQAAYSPNWTTYTDSADFMVYNNSNPTKFTICGATTAASTRVEAESYVTMTGMKITDKTTYKYVGSIDSGDTSSYSVNVKSPIKQIKIRVGKASTGGKLSFRLDSPTGQEIASISPSSTGGWETFVDQTATLVNANVTGQKTIYIVGSGAYGIANVDYFEIGY